MAQVPDHLRPGVFRRPQHGEKTAPVIHARAAFDEVPAQAIAYGANASLGEQPVVRRRPDVVPGALQHINLAGVRTSMRGAFESAHKKALEQRGRRPQGTHKPRMRSQVPRLSAAVRKAPLRRTSDLHLNLA